MIEHRALEARVGTHVDAHLLAHEAGIAIGREAVEEDPEGLPGARVQAQNAAPEFADRREVADERDTRSTAKTDSQARVLGGLDAVIGGIMWPWSRFFCLRDPPSILRSIHM